MSTIYPSTNICRERKTENDEFDTKTRDEHLVYGKKVWQISTLNHRNVPIISQEQRIFLGQGALIT